MKTRNYRINICVFVLFIISIIFVACDIDKTTSKTDEEGQDNVLAYIYEASPLVVFGDASMGNDALDMYKQTSIHRMNERPEYRGLYPYVERRTDGIISRRNYSIGEKANSFSYLNTQYGRSVGPFSYNGMDIYRYTDPNNYFHVVDLYYADEQEPLPSRVFVTADVGTYPILETHIYDVLSWTAQEYENYARSFLKEIGSLDVFASVETFTSGWEEDGIEYISAYETVFTYQIDGYNTEYKAGLEITPMLTAQPACYAFDFYYYDLADVYAPYSNVQIDEARIAKLVEERIQGAYNYNVMDWNIRDTTLVVRDGILKALVEVGVTLDDDLEDDEPGFFDINKILIDIAGYCKADEVSPEDLVVSK